MERRKEGFFNMMLNMISVMTFVSCKEFPDHEVKVNHDFDNLTILTSSALLNQCFEVRDIYNSVWKNGNE